MHTNKKKDMSIIENPNPVPTHVFTCGRCSCKFECRDGEADDSFTIRHEHDGDANGRLGGTRHWSSTKSYIWPSTDYCIDVDTVGFDSSMAGNQHVTEDWSLAKDFA